MAFSSIPKRVYCVHFNRSYKRQLRDNAAARSIMIGGEEACSVSAGRPAVLVRLEHLADVKGRASDVRSLKQNRHDRCDRPPKNPRTEGTRLIQRRVRIEYDQLTAAKVSNPKFREKRGNSSDISMGISQSGMCKFESSQVSQPFLRSARLPERRENGPEIRAFFAHSNWSLDSEFA